MGEAGHGLGAGAGHGLGSGVGPGLAPLVGRIGYRQSSLAHGLIGARPLVDGGDTGLVPLGCRVGPGL